jgi:hypothetical protein
MDYTILYSILLDPHVYQSSMYLYPILYIVIDKKVFFLPMEYIEKEEYSKSGHQRGAVTWVWSRTIYQPLSTKRPGKD